MMVPLRHIVLFALSAVVSGPLFAQSVQQPTSATQIQGMPRLPAPAVRVFLVAGQSNAEGGDTKSSEIDSYPPFVGAGAPQFGASFWYEHGGILGYSSAGWIPLQPATQTQVLGPELTFGPLVKGATHAPVAIIKSTKGGTNLAIDWDRGNTAGEGMYDRTLTLVQMALADLTSQGISWSLEGVLWQQGESDMLDNQFVTEYQKRLGVLIENLRTDLGMPELQWFLGETSFKGIWGISDTANMQTLRAAQLAVAAKDPLVEFVPTSHLAFKVNETLAQPHFHFGTEGMLQLGEAYADAYLARLGIDSTHKSQKFCCGIPAAAGATVRVFVIAGQRSADGEQAYVDQIGKYPVFSSLDKPQENVLYRYRLGGGAHVSTDWGPLGPTDYLGNFGPELSFGESVAARLDDPIAVIKISDGAAFLVDWLPAPGNASRPQYRDALTFINASLSNLTHRGFTPVLEAVIWVPGEHDAWWAPYRKKYAANLTKLVRTLRTDLAAPQLKWFVAELADNMIWGKTNLDELDAQIQRVADADPLLWFVDTDTVPTRNLAATFETEGVLFLGKLLAAAYLATP